MTSENCGFSLPSAQMGLDLAQPVPEFGPIELLHAFQRIGLAVPKPDRGKGHTVEGVRLHHRIMRLVKKRESLAGFSRAGETVIADDVASQA